MGLVSEVRRTRNAATNLLSGVFVILLSLSIWLMLSLDEEISGAPVMFLILAALGLALIVGTLFDVRKQRKLLNTSDG